jgi:hypothetical protein
MPDKKLLPSKKFFKTDWTRIPDPGRLKQVVDLDGSIACGVNSGGEIWCKDDLESANWFKVPGSLKYISVSKSKLYGVNSNNDIFYADNYK